MCCDPSGHSVTLFVFLTIVGITTVCSAIDGGLSAVVCGQSFWKGFAAGAISGLVGGTVTAALTMVGLGPWASVIGRGINTAVYGLTNEVFQNGNLDNMQWGAYGFDIFVDIIFSMGYADLGFVEKIGNKILKNVVGTLTSGIIDGFIDIAQSYLFYKDYGKEEQKRLYNTI